MTDIDFPAGLLAFAERGEEWAVWLDALPELVRDIVAEWELTVDGPAMHGYCALVLPVVEASGRPAVAKFSWPHDEEEHEHVGLKRLDGDGMVRLYRADPTRHALLLERLHAGKDLRSIDVLAACEIVAGLYSRIHVPAPPQLRTLTSYVDRWNTDTKRLAVDAPVPRRMVEQSISLAADFVADPDSVGTMIHGDLHYENVLAADREPWLVIDPKPMSGDRHYEVAPMLWNRWDEALATGHVRDAVRERFFALVDAAGLDEDRARDWVVVRMVHNAMWALQDAEEQGRPLGVEDTEWITQCVTIVKAMG